MSRSDSRPFPGHHPGRSSGKVLDFFGAARLQGIVIGALMMREIHTRYGRDNLGFLWLIAEPLIFCFGVVVIWVLSRPPYDHGVPIVAFVITGYLPLTLWRHIVFRSVHCFRSNAHLLYHRQVRMLDLLIARILLEISGNFVAYFVIAFVFYSIGFYELPKDIGMFYLGWFYMILFSAGLGLIFGCVTEMYEWAEKLIGPLTYFMLPVSGMFFMVEWIPEQYRHIVMFVPTVHAFELIRGGQFGPDVVVHYDLPYVTFVCSALIAFGLILCQRIHRHLIVE